MEKEFFYLGEILFSTGSGTERRRSIDLIRCWN